MKKRTNLYFFFRWRKHLFCPGSVCSCVRAGCKLLTGLSWIFLALLLIQCGTKPGPPMLERLPSTYTGIDFSNQLTETEDLNILTFEYFYNGAGVGIGDINNDGLKDIFFTGNQVSNRLYLNTGEFRFRDITREAGLTSSGKWATGVSLTDINQDGWLDIYVCYAGPFADPESRANELYINNRDNTFSERAGEYGLADTGHTTHAAFFDYDRDGDLDLYLLNNITDETGPNVIRPKRIKGEMANTDKLYKNNGDNTFTDVSREAGITIEGYGLGVSACDINGDGWTDVFVSNDYLSNDIMYINNGNGTFTDHASRYFRHTSYSAMGNDVADFNNDGLPDILAVDMLPPDNKRQKLMFGATNEDRYRSEIAYGYDPQYMRNTLQLNRGLSPSGEVMFSEIGQLAGIHATDWSWSPLFADLDNDGFKDIVITNGYPRDITNRDFASYKANELLKEGYNEGVKNKLLSAISKLEGAYLPNFVFRNNHDLTFHDESSQWGFTEPSYTTGAAYADLDNDGDLDIVMNNTNAQAFVYKNHQRDQTQNHYIRVNIRGPQQNRNGFGVKVTLRSGGNEQYQELSPFRGFQSTMEDDIHFGLGKDTVAASIVVRWPDGKILVREQVKADQVIEVDYADAVLVRDPVAVNSKGIQPDVVESTAQMHIDVIHRETYYADFKIQPLLPHKYSGLGPGIAVADINNDGLDDFFTGGAYNQSGSVTIQRKDGSFESSALTAETKYEEDMGVLLFDADGDQDKDLYIVSGGNEFPGGSRYYQDRLYIQEGGKFIQDKNALPRETASGSCVVAADFDRDGDLDLFVGGRLSPQQYPDPGESFLLQNRGGRFVDVTDSIAPGLKHAGMVTSALFTDVDNDKDPDLLVTGEWMPVQVYINDNGKFNDQTGRFGLSKSVGWWNSVTAADIDSDGDTDYVLGNLGLNSRFTTSPDKRLKVFVDDFNRDGRREAILAGYINGTLYPVHPRDDLFQQMPQLKKHFTSYQDYSEETMEHFLSTVNAVQPRVYEADIFASCILINRGGSAWKLIPLPAEAQFAPVYGIIVNDFNDDNRLDLMLTGNSYAPDVLTGRYDAGKGLILHGNAEGTFTAVPADKSGLVLEGDAKGLALLVDGTHPDIILSSVNDGAVRAWTSASEKDTCVSLDEKDAYVLITLTDGRVIKREMFFGDGYLSQSSRRLCIDTWDVRRIEVFNNRGEGRDIEFSK